MMPTQSQNIKIDLLLSGVTQASIATMLQVTPVAVNHVVFGRRATPRIREAIANSIGKPVSEIWPELAERKEDRK